MKKRKVGRPADTPYKTYVKGYKKLKAAGVDMDMPMKLSKKAFTDFYDTASGSTKNAKIKDILFQQTHGYTRSEKVGRHKWWKTEEMSKAGVKWRDVAKMNHQEFVEAYGRQISDMYNKLHPGLSGKEVGELIGFYIFGSE